MLFIKIVTLETRDGPIEHPEEPPQENHPLESEEQCGSHRDEDICREHPRLVQQKQNHPGSKINILGADLSKQNHKEEDVER